MRLYKCRDTSARINMADAALLLVAMVWGSSYPAVKLALAYTTVLAFVFIRFSLAGIFMLPILLRGMKGRSTKTLWCGAIQGVLLFLIFVFETAGVQKTSAANAAFFISTCVLMTPILEFLIFKKPLSGETLLACLLSCIGAAMIGLNSSFSLRLNEGDFIILAAALLRSAGIIVTKYWVGDKDLDSGALTAIQMLTVALLAGVGLIAFDQGGHVSSITTNPTFWLTTLYLVIFCTLIAFYIQTHMVRKTSPTRVILIMGMEPVFGAAFAILLLSESLTVWQYAGGLLIIASTYIAVVRKPPATALGSPNS
ncbi:DMT family transporter [Pseudomonas alloputida]|uniref:DMT family transporter n=1 Tax=Pseudomonas TaxID=286 RepID=UPI003EEB6BA8